MTAPVDVIIDTNVVLDWLVFRDPRVAHLDQALRSATLRWCTCAPMLQELAHVLARPPLNTRPVDRQALQIQLDTWAHHVDAPGPVPARPGLRCSDTDDQIFIELALARGAPLLFSRDRAVLKLARKAAQVGLRITTPERWQAQPTPPASEAPALVRARHLSRFDDPGHTQHYLAAGAAP
jgi:predicted nucleic acid-binding protein